MYYLCRFITKENKTHIERIRTISLAGNRNGQIYKFLGDSLRQNQSEPYKWHLEMRKHLAQNEVIIIDIKPTSKHENSLFICELTDVYGYSDHGWTPVLLRMKGLYVDKPNITINKECFIYPADAKIIYTMLYLSGSVQGGKLLGSWKFPGPSPTNAVLLWPEALSYFVRSIRDKDPNFISSI
jgi:hypothetical protein